MKSAALKESNIMTEERKYQEMLQRIRGFRLLDDDFMTKCFEENIEATELVLRIVLNKPDIKVVKVQTQYSIKNIKGRSLRLDIYATDSENFTILTDISGKQMSILMTVPTSYM